jgi:uncharacterized protein (TIGR02246 family)
MSKTMIGSLAAVWMVALSGCGSAPPPPAPAMDVAAEQAKVKDIEAGWVKEVVAKDVEKLAGHYTDDAVMMAPGMPAFKGKDAIRGAWKMMLDDPNFKLTFSSDRVEISKAGDFAFSKGTYASTMTNPKTKKPVDDKGSYVTVFQKQADGGWKAVEDINTSEASQ